MVRRKLFVRRYSFVQPLFKGFIFFTDCHLVFHCAFIEDRVVRIYRRPWNTHVYEWVPHGSGLTDPANLRCNFCTPVPQSPGYGSCSCIPDRNFCKFSTPRRNTRNFWMFCKPFIPVPGTAGSSVTLSYPYSDLFFEFGTTRATIPGVRVQHVLRPPGASVSSVCLCHNTRNFREFCTISIPVPESSGSSVKPPYPYPESTKPTEHSLESK